MPVLADVGSATFALVLALAVTIGLILWQTQRQWSRTYSRWRYREELEEPSFHSGVTAEELARWEVRMHELVRDLQGQLIPKSPLWPNWWPRQNGSPENWRNCCNKPAVVSATLPHLPQ